ncbi:Uncharacterised protein [Segatella copri]|nr:Uncharacterised protein [Segatella copri]
MKPSRSLGSRMFFLPTMLFSITSSFTNLGTLSLMSILLLPVKGLTA